MDVNTYNSYGLLEKAEELELIPVPKDEDDWKKGRKKTIGGSDVGAILGLNKYSSPLKVYRSKTEDTSDQEDMISRLPSVRKGKELEDWILETKVKPYFENYDVFKPEHMFKNINYPWLVGNLDGIGVLKNKPYHSIADTIGIEIKLVTEYGELAWNNPEYYGIPPYYFTQVQTYMAITGIEVFHVCAMFENNWEFKVYTVPKDTEFIYKTLIPETKKFYNDHILMGIPPKPIPSIDSDEINKMLPEVGLKPTVSSEELDAMLEEYASLDDVNRSTELALNIMKDRIIQKFIEGSRPTEKSSMSVSFSKSNRTSVNSAKLKEEMPDIYDKYSSQTTYTKWNFKRNKK